MQKLLDFARPASGVRLFPFFFFGSVYCHILYIYIFNGHETRNYISTYVSILGARHIVTDKRCLFNESLAGILKW
jgi:hypothetical protein